MTKLSEIQASDVTNHALVRQGDEVVKKTKKGFIGRTIEWIFGDTNDCNVLACLTKAMEKDPSLIGSDFAIFYELKNKLSEHKKEGGFFTRLVDKILGRDDVEAAIKEFDHVGHARLRELFYGTKEGPEAIDNALVDNHYAILQNKISFDPQDLEGFEYTLTQDCKLNDAQIVERYEKLATAGFPMAAVRLFQAYSQGIFGGQIDLGKAADYEEKASKLGAGFCKDKGWENAQLVKFLFRTDTDYLPDEEVNSLRNTLTGQDFSEQVFENYEARLTKQNYQHNEIVERYEELANAGYSGAAFRLTQMHNRGLLGQDYAKDKIDKYTEKMQTTPAFEAWLTPLLSTGNMESSRDDLKGFYNTMKDPHISSEECEKFEKGLKEKGWLENWEIIGRYKAMAEAGLAGAALRLSQIYTNGLLGAGRNPQDAAKYAGQARRSSGI